MAKKKNQISVKQKVAVDGEITIIIIVLASMHF